MAIATENDLIRLDGCECVRRAALFLIYPADARLVARCKMGREKSDENPREMKTNIYPKHFHFVSPCLFSDQIRLGAIKNALTRLIMSSSYAASSIMGFASLRPVADRINHALNYLIKQLIASQVIRYIFMNPRDLRRSLSILKIKYSLPEQFTLLHHCQSGCR